MNRIIKGQQEAIEKIKQGGNIFLTGGGGTGKSFIINTIKDNKTVLVAPTGIAALNIGGATCHSFFGLPFGLPEEHDKYKLPAKSKKVLERATRIVLDEVGMMRADYLDLIDHKLKAFFKNKKPFGGIQMVMVGDFYQLEPIIQSNEEYYFHSEYSSPFAFSAKCWNFETTPLTEVVRQSDEYYISILEAIRKGDTRGLELLSQVIDEYKQGTEKLYLCCYNADADKINRWWYDKNPTKEEYSFKARFSSNWGKPNSYPVENILKLKKGCKVILCANNSEEGYVNGQRGTVDSITKGELYVKLDNGNTIKVAHHTWEKIGYTEAGESFTKKVEATFTQLPIKLGWAVSVHKSQGMTLEGINLHTGTRGCFSHGQLYVALSRVKDLSTISLVKPLKDYELIVKEEVKEFYNNEEIVL